MSNNTEKLVSFLDELITHAKGGMCIALPLPCVDTLERLKHIVEHQAESQERALVLWKDSQNGWMHNFVQISEPVIEKVSETSFRLVAEIQYISVDRLRKKFQLPLIPAPLDATDAIVRATHALAGAALEMTQLLKDLQKPTITPQLDFMERLQTEEKGTDDGSR